jgi:hypothetical protein
MVPFFKSAVPQLPVPAFPVFRLIRARVTGLASIITR